VRVCKCTGVPLPKNVSQINSHLLTVVLNGCMAVDLMLSAAKAQAMPNLPTTGQCGASTRSALWDRRALLAETLCNSSSCPFLGPLNTRRALFLDFCAARKLPDALAPFANNFFQFVDLDILTNLAQECNAC